MALSSGPRSNSSASKAPKPTYRRASAAGKGPANNTTVKSKPKAAPKAARKVSKPAASAKVGKAAKPALGMKAAKAPKAAPAPAKQLPKVAKPVAKGGKPLPKPAKPLPKMAKPAVKAPAPVAQTRKKTIRLPGFLKPGVAALGTVGAAIGSLVSRIPLPRLSRKVLLAAAGGVVALLVVAVIVANSGLFAATEIQVQGSAHVEQETAEQLVKVQDGTTLLNVDEAAIMETLESSPWVAGVDIQREWPHKLIITPVEHSVEAIAYITADELAWGISGEGTWIAPLSLTIAVDAEGNEVALNDDGSVPEGATQLAPADAALRLAQEAGALMLTDVPSDANPKSGEEVTSEVVLAGLEYAKGFSSEFVNQIKDLSVASVESIAAFLTSGVEVSLGTPDNITEKERVVTRLLEQQEGVTYINVREPGAYTFRSAPQ